MVMVITDCKVAGKYIQYIVVRANESLVKEAAHVTRVYCQDGG